MSLRFKVSPELVDGDHWSVFDRIDQVIEAIQEWHNAGQSEMKGESFTVEMVEMSDEEVAALPEICP